MKHSNYILYAFAAVVAISCAKTVAPGPNDANKRFFDAWMTINHPGAERIGRGTYILEDTPGTGTEVKKDGYVLMDYTVTDLDGKITSYTSKVVSKQLGDYDTTKYYGPRFLTTFEESIQAGLMDAIDGMKSGGRRKVVIPGWMMSYSNKATEQDYLNEESSNSDCIYDITIKDFAESANDWQNDSIVRFFKNNQVKVFDRPASEVFVKNGTPMTMADTVQAGFWYKKVAMKAGADTSAFKSDTTIYINYTGKLLNGLVFDTNIKKVALDNGLYSSSRTYEPVQINWGEKAEDITMGNDKNEIIDGFGLTLWQMREFEKGVGVFYSLLGYSYSGSGSAIPAFASLIFEIEIVEKPE